MVLLHEVVVAPLLTEDAEWVFLEQFIFAIRGRSGRSARNQRLVLDGVQ